MTLIYKHTRGVLLAVVLCALGGAACIAFATLASNFQPAQYTLTAE